MPSLTDNEICIGFMLVCIVWSSLFFMIDRIIQIKRK